MSDLIQGLIEHHRLTHRDLFLAIERHNSLVLSALLLLYAWFPCVVVTTSPKIGLLLIKRVLR